MKSSLSLLALFGLTVTAAQAAVGFFGSYVNVTLNGTPQWYDLQAPSGGRASNPPDFNGYNFGTIDLTLANTLGLTGAEGLTFKKDGGDVTGVQFFYRVYLQSATPPAFTGPNTVGWTSEAPFNDAAGTNYGGGGDQKWAQTSGWQPVNLLTGLPLGDYYFEIYLKGTSNEGDFYSSNFGNNFKSSFTLVPEPGSAMLGLAGLSLFVLRRTRRA